VAGAAPRARGTRLKDFRVAIWASSPETLVDDSVATPFAAAIEAIAKTGTSIDDSARPVDLAENQRLFMLLLRAATASRLRDEDFAEQQRIAASLAPGDDSPRAHIARGATVSHRAWAPATSSAANCATCGTISSSVSMCCWPRWRRPRPTRMITIRIAVRAG
jgi:amidase